jgi:YD repeat-containing protein
MSDLAKWKVHGPVENLRSEFAVWDLNREDWEPPRHFTITSFRADGAVSSCEAHNFDGSIARSQWLYDDAGRLTEVDVRIDDGPNTRTLYSYDEAGRHVRTVQLSHAGVRTESEICSYDPGGEKTKVSFLGSPGATVTYGIEGTDHAYGAPGATKMTTTYDDRDLPAKVVFEDDKNNSVREVIITRDGEGRSLTEEVHFSTASPFPDLLDKAPPESREGLAAALKNAFGGTFSSTTYAYDNRGQLVERTIRMGSLGGHRTTYRYDDHDNPIDETNETAEREANVEENGTVQYNSDRETVQHNHFEYRYDGHGNWTERIVSFRMEQNADYQRSNIERRIITYYAR